MDQRTTDIKENKMGTQPISKLIISMSLPMMASMLMLALYNVVDSIFVSRISEDALTAVSLVFPFQMLVIAVAVGTGIGVSSLVARRLGEKDQTGANDAAANGQFLALLSSLVFMVIFGFFSRPLMELFVDKASILDYATSYLFICGTFSIFCIFQVMNEKTLQGTGNTVYPMIIQFVGAIINIIFDPILIFGLLGFPALGVAGAAIATVGGQFVGMLLSVYFVYSRNKLLHITLKGFRPHGGTIKQIYAVGLPSIIMQAIGSICTFGMNKILILFTPTAVSVLGVYFKLQSFVFMPVFGLNSGTMPIIGYNFGAKNKQRLLHAFKLGALYALIIMVVGMAVFEIFAPQLLAMFDASESMLSIGIPALRIISLCFPSAALCIMAGTFFSAIGDGVYSLIVSVCRQLIVILPLAYILAMAYGLTAVWYAYPLAEFASLAISALLLVRSFRRRIIPLQVA
ncbi:MAG: MATE family efflux transporter [Clostridia bacterium]